jgi:predicted solute-binding protein
VADLAALWHGRFSLPFVFARWVVRKDAPDPVKAALHQWLKQFEGQEEHLIQQAAPKVARRLGLPVDYARHYLKVIRRCLSSQDEAGQERFLNELKQHARTPLFPGGAPGLPRQDRK